MSERKPPSAFKFIPPMTDPLSRYWEQPSTENILLDDNYALMSPEDFAALHEYSTSIPTGKYVGKMWKRNENGTWFLIWYDVDDEPGYLRMPYREIIVCQP